MKKPEFIIKTPRVSQEHLAALEDVQKPTKYAYINVKITDAEKYKLDLALLKQRLSITQWIRNMIDELE